LLFDPIFERASAVHAHSKGTSMTRTVHFADHVLTAGTFAGKHAQAMPLMARKSHGAGPVVEPAPAVSIGSNLAQVIEAYPWLTATTLQNMSVRAQRLMRMGY
jgi:hypothetical protein